MSTVTDRLPTIHDLDGPGELDRRAAEFRARWDDLPTPVRLRWSDRPVLLLENGRPWLYGPARRDPMAVGSRSVLPRSQARALARFAATDVPVREVAIAHELDPRGPVTRLLPTLQQGPRTCSDEVARALVGPVPPHPALAGTVRLLERLAHGAAHAAAAGGGLLLDPIVFVVIGRDRPAHGEPALFYPLAVWRW